MSDATTIAKVEDDQPTDNANFAMDTDSLLDQIGEAITAQSEMKLVHAADKIAAAQTAVNMFCLAVRHCQQFGDIRPLGRVLVDLKMNKVIKRALRNICPDLARLERPKDAENDNTFMTMIRDGKTSMTMTFDADHLEWVEEVLMIATNENKSPFDKDFGWPSRYPDIAPKNMDKLKKSMTKGLQRKIEDLANRGQELTEAEMKQCVSDAYAEFRKAAVTEKANA